MKKSNGVPSDTELELILKTVNEVLSGSGFILGKYSFSWSSYIRIQSEQMEYRFIHDFRDGPSVIVERRARDIEGPWLHTVSPTGGREFDLPYGKIVVQAIDALLKSRKAK